MKLNKSDYIMQAVAHGVLAVLTIMSLLPFILLVIASVTDENVAIKNGFSFFPEKWSSGAYEYLIGEWSQIGHAYLMTIIVTVVGTALSIIVTTMFAYALSDKELFGRRVLNFMCIFTMLFSGGIVASYYCWNQVFHIRDTIFALIFPGLMMNAFNVILVKNYFTFSIPESLKEAARIDGAGEIKTFTSIIVPLSRPIIATIGLMTGLIYWNDWTNGLYYLTTRGGSKYYTIQLVLNQINENINYLSQNASKMGGVSVGSLPSTTMRMAIAVVGILPVIIVYPFLQKYFVRGITMGAVKE